MSAAWCRRFVSIFSHRRSFLTQKGGSVADATPEIIGRGVRSTFLTPRASEHVATEIKNKQKAIVSPIFNDFTWLFLSNINLASAAI